MPKTEFTENMRRFCREIDLQDNPAIYIAEAIDKGDLSHNELKALIADDHNLLDAATVNYLVSNKIISESELENDCGIDRGFVDMLGTPITEMIDVEGSIDHIDEGSLEVYLWGIPSSGKTCALGSILCAAKTNRNVVLSVEPVTNNAHDFGYESKLESIFTNNGDFCVLPGRTPVKTNFAIGLQLEDLKNEVHPVTLIDMAGELFCYLQWLPAGSYDKYDERHQDALGSLNKILVNNPSENRKIHIFIIEYGAERKAYKGTLQDQYLTTGLTYLKNNGVLENHTDGIYVLVTKTDKVAHNLKEGEYEMNHIEDFIHHNYSNFMGLLDRCCRDYKINGGKLPPPFMFDIGDVCFKNFCRMNTDQASEVVTKILLAAQKKKSLWDRILRRK